MISITLTWAEVEMAAHVGLRRQIESLRRNLPDKHGLESAGWTEHVEGAAGELVVARAFKRYWGGDVGTFKKGDIGNIQVRTRLRTDYDLIIREDDSNEDYFVLVVGRCPNYRIVGYIQGQEAKQEQWLQNYGNRPPAYFVPQRSLHQLVERIS